jgi:CSLREA domain-containing protein
MLSRIFLFPLIVLLFCANVSAATFIVTNTGNTDDGTCNIHCSLREAINVANNLAGNDKITFNISGAGPHIITLNNVLPNLSSDINIDNDDAGAETVTVARSSASNTPDFRIFSITTGNTVSISGLTISKGSASGDGLPGEGGGILNDGMLNISNSIISNNFATGSAGVFNRGTLTLSNSSITNNSATNGIYSGSGGGITNTGTMSISNSTISHNLANGGRGGGIFNANTLSVSNSTISNNSTAGGGGAIFSERTLSVSNSTLTGNRANSIGTGSGAGGGIYATGSATLSNSIVAGNLGGSDNIPDDISGTINTANFSIVGDAATSGGITNGTNGNIVGNNGNGTRDISTILNTSLANNGGPTQTHALLPGSPAIDAGQAALAVDQRGLPRPSDFNGIRNAGNDSNNGDDIGAFELQAPANQQSGPNFTVTKTADTNDGSCATNDCSLREAINAANAALGDNTITFSLLVFNTGKTITLAGSELSIEDNGALTIDNLTGHHITIDANNASRVFYVNGATVSLNNLNITGGNSVGREISGNGGGIYNNGGTLTIVNSTVSRNSAKSFGGGLFTAEGSLNLRDSNVSHNVADHSAGLFTIRDTVEIEHCTLAGNVCRSVPVSGSSGGNGGGININSGSKVTLRNSTLSGNSAALGGGVLNYATLVMQSCTITNNIATYPAPEVSGGGIYNAQGSTATLSNTIVDQNVGVVPDVQGTYASQGFNLIGDTTGSSGFGTTGDILNQPAGLDSLQDNGGPTHTHALLPRSPAINKGNSNLSADQRGIVRPQGRGSDIGAYEAVLVEIGDTSIGEGHSGTKNTTFQVTLSSPLPQEISLSYQFFNGSAKAGHDFDASTSSDSDGATRGLLTIPAGQTSGNITVSIKGDSINEDNEFFYVLLSSQSGLAFSRGRGKCTILDDDRAPAITIQDVTIAEGHSSSRSALFALNLSAPSGRIVTVEYATANGTARSGSDYTAVPLQTVRFGVGQISVVVRVPVTGDKQVEADEAFYVLLSNASNASIGRGRGMGTIQNDDSSQ